jgi:hypothetical protein
MSYILLVIQNYQIIFCFRRNFIRNIFPRIWFMSESNYLKVVIF